MLEGSIDININMNLGRGLLTDIKTAIAQGFASGSKIVKEQKAEMQPKGLMGKIGGVAEGLGLPAVTGPLAIIAGGIALLVQSSEILKGVLSGIGKLIMLIIKPLGDILGVALMPLLFILKPVGVFFNTLMRPYIQKAMAAMRVGGALLGKGDFAGATVAFALGAAYLIKPFQDLSLKAGTEIVAGLADLMSNIPIVGGAFKGMGDMLRTASQGFVETTTNILDNQLGAVLSQAEQATGRSMLGMVKGLKDAEVAAGYATGLLAGTITANVASSLVDLNDWIGGQWGPNFYTSVQDALNSAIGKMTVPTAHMGAYSPSKSTGNTPSYITNFYSGTASMQETYNAILRAQATAKASATTSEAYKDYARSQGTA